MCRSMDVERCILTKLEISVLTLRNVSRSIYHDLILLMSIDMSPDNFTCCLIDLHVVWYRYIDKSTRR